MGEYWLSLCSIHSPFKPTTGWSVINKEQDRLIYVPSICTLHFTWSSVVSAKLLTNYPDCYSNELHMIENCSYKTNEHQYQATLNINKAGNFQLQMELQDGRKSEIGYFIVEPKLENISLSSIICETVLTKNLGPFSRWEPILERIRSLQYNMIHFTPVNVLGISGSCYSIYHHHQLTNQISEGDSSITEEEKEKKLEKLLQGFAEKGLFSICDVVWNHTAINTPWLLDHPDATFNLTNSPHLRPAYALDRALQRFHKKLQRRAEIVATLEDVNKVIDELNRKILPSIKLWEFSIIDIPKQVTKFREYLESQDHTSPDKLIIEHQHHPLASGISEECILPGDGRRGSKTVRLSCILQIFRDNKESAAAKCLSLRRLLDRYNESYYKQWDADREKILDNLKNLLFHERVSPEGPRYPFITDENPLFPKYFTTLVNKKFVCQHTTEEEDEEEDDDFIQDLRVDGACNQVCANAGWVFGSENTIDLIAPKHRIYLCRQLVVWSDSVKLRYGNKPEDSPFLWNYMKEYTCQIARLFHGIRIDNCHSTPLPIARYLLQAARSVRPNLIVIAELFTQPKIEIQYCEQLGLTFLIREAMDAKTPKELGDKVYKFSGGISKAIGSLYPNSLSLSKNPFYDSVHQRVYLSPMHPKDMFMDCTHDNQPPSVLRTAGDALPNSTMVAMTNCSIGSVLGYDQLVPHQINVVTENCLYPLEIIGGGMECCKLLLHSLHKVLSDRDYDEFHVHQEGNIIMIVRHHPETHKSVYVLIHAAFHDNHGQQFSFPAFTYSGEFVEELFVGLIRTDKIPFTRDPKLINGIIPTLYWPHQTPIPKTTGAMYSLYENTIQLHKFPRGSVIGFSTKLPKHVENAKMKLAEISNEKRIQEAICELSLVDLNRVLYRTGGEEGIGTYHVPTWGDMVYCGLVGIILCFNSVDEEQTISHPICDNLREGPWLLDFLRDRFILFPRLHSWISQVHELLKKFYSFLLPKYFHQHVARLYHQCVQRAIHLMSDFVKQGDSFTKALALCSIQMYGDVSSGPLRFLDHENGKKSPSLAAGLPHFASGYMRTWGRDTFISLRGLFLVTGRFDDALSLITGFASCLRHGLIPNLLDSGRNPRYNARDAVWWFVQAVQDYCEFVYPNNPADVVSFLQQTNVERYFPSDDPGEPRGTSTNSLAEILREIIERHATGISYREWNAGVQIDSHMSDQGFNVEIHCNPETGFIYGGNAFNCGTWMDKMGESTEFGNMGVPSTPRDGADIEIIGLLASCLRWLNELSDHGFNNDPIVVHNKEWTYSEWYKTILANFEKYFWIPKNGTDDKDHVIDLSLVTRRGIYKDTVGATDSASDYCFRPNLCIAMVVAPELFNSNHAKIALNNVTRLLLGRLGMKTLDPSHPRYAPFYDTQSTKNYYEAKGFNYHQGPEWVWVTGYYLRARLHFEHENPKICEEINEILFEHKMHIQSSPWAGIPELTNKDGEHCASSCPTQAWSAATILDSLHKLYIMEERKG